MALFFGGREGVPCVGSLYVVGSHCNGSREIRVKFPLIYPKVWGVRVKLPYLGLWVP